jgi:hypothetical protein
MRPISPSPLEAKLQVDLTLPLGRSRGTSGEGLFFQLKSTQNMQTQSNFHLALPASSFLLSDPP